MTTKPGLNVSPLSYWSTGWVVSQNPANQSQMHKMRNSLSEIQLRKRKQKTRSKTTQLRTQSQTQTPNNNGQLHTLSRASQNYLIKKKGLLIRFVLLVKHCLYHICYHTEGALLHGHELLEHILLLLHLCAEHSRNALKDHLCFMVS